MFPKIERNANAEAEGSSPGAEGGGGEEREVTIVEPDEDDQDAQFIKNFLYDEKEMNKFLDNVFVEVGSQEVRNVGSTLREACQEKDLTQLIRGSSHLAAIYIADKMAKLLVKGGVEKVKKKVLQSQGKKQTALRRLQGQIQKRRRIAALAAEREREVNGDGGTTGTGSRNVGVASGTATTTRAPSTQDQPGTSSSSATSEAEADRAAQVSPMEHFGQNQLEGMPFLLPLGTAPILQPPPSPVPSVGRDNDNDNVNGNRDADAEEEELPPPSSAPTPTPTSGITRTPGKRVRKRTIRYCNSIDINAGRRVVAASASGPSPTPPIIVTTINGKKKKIYTCPVAECKRELHSHNGLKYHVALHSDYRPFRCQFGNCTRTFIQKGERTKHQNRMHKTQKKRPFKCPFAGCEKTFATKDSFKSHATTHTDERPFECSNCSQGFKRIADLRRHVRFVRCVQRATAN